MKDLQLALECRYDFRKFSEKILGLEFDEFHLECIRKILEGKDILIEIPRGHGKCLAKGTRVWTKNGLKNIEDCSHETTYSLSEDYRICESNAFMIPDGRKPCVKIRTWSGRELTCTLSHPLLTIEGWKSVIGLKVGEKIATPRANPFTGFETMPDAELVVLGWMLSEGTMSASVFSNKDLMVVDDMRRACSFFGWTMKKRERRGYDYCISFNWKKEGSLRELLKKHGIAKCSSKNKFVPQTVFNSSNRQIALFLNRLYGGDGCITLKSNTPITYDTISKQLALDVQLLLLRFGILSKVGLKRSKCNGLPYISYRVIIQDKPNILRFLENIGKFGCEKKGRLMVESLVNIKHAPNRDTIPSEYRQYFNGKQFWLRKKGIRTDNKYDISREKLRHVALADENKKLLTLAESDVFWDEILEITPVGDKEVFDMVVPDHHNFVAEGMFVHNTTLCKAFIIWRLWREKKYRVLLASSSLGQSSTIMEEIQAIFQNTPELKTLIPPSSNNTAWNQKEIWLSNGNRFFVKPFNDSARGPHVNLLILDDILRTEDISDDKMRETVNGVFYPMTETLKGQKVIVGTPMRTDDLFSEIKKDPYFTTIHMEGVIRDAQGNWIKPLWEKNRTLEDLKRTRLQMGNLMFSREILCCPLAGGSSLFTEDMLKQVHDGESLEREKGCRYYLGWDVAMAEGGDYTAFSVIRKNRDGLLHQVRLERYQGMREEKQIERYKTLCKIFQPAKCLVESNGLSVGLALKLSEDDLETRSFTEGFHTNKSGKEELIGALQGLLDTKSLWLLNNQILLDELRHFGIKKDRTGKETYEALGGHDDCVIATALSAKAASRSMGVASIACV